MTKRATPKRSRKIAVWERDGFECRYCGRPVALPEPETPACLWATVDHAIPRSKGGSNRIGNLVTACAPCNKRKADKSAAEFIDSGKAKLSFSGWFPALEQLRRTA
jgi:5-methylcytosine-specific restriction endonuclease McrA